MGRRGRRPPPSTSFCFLAVHTLCAIVLQKGAFPCQPWELVGPLLPLIAGITAPYPNPSRQQNHGRSWLGRHYHYRRTTYCSRYRVRLSRSFRILCHPVPPLSSSASQKPASSTCYNASIERNNSDHYAETIRRHCSSAQPPSTSLFVLAPASRAANSPCGTRSFCLKAWVATLL